jgi:hypothetical protein
MGECSPDMAGTREIKYPEQTKTSTAALQFDIGLSRATGRKPRSIITWSYRLGVDEAGQPPAHRKKKTAKKPIGKNLDGYNLRQQKLHNRTIWLGTLNVQGIRNKTGEIIKGLEELKQDIMIIFIVALCILKIHLLSHTNKCTNYIIYYLKSVLIIDIKTLILS